MIPKPSWEDQAECDAWADRLRESLRLALSATGRAPGTGPIDAPRPSSLPKHSVDVVLPPPKLPPRGLPPDRDRIIVLGASTGGVQAIRSLLADFPGDSPGIVVVQHMPAGFTGAHAERLHKDPAIELEVAEARQGELVRRGLALIVPGGDRHGVVRRVDGGYRVELLGGPPVSRFRPSVDVLFRSAAIAAGDRAVGVILTGMLDDGVQGLLEMREAGALTIAQDQATSTVFGMNAEAIRRGAARLVLPLDRIAEAAVAGRE